MAALDSGCLISSSVGSNETEVQRKDFRDQAKEGDQARTELKSKDQLYTEMDDHHALVTEKKAGFT